MRVDLLGPYSNQNTYFSRLLRFVNQILAHFFENFHRVTMFEPPTKRLRTELSLEDKINLINEADMLIYIES